MLHNETKIRKQTDFFYPRTPFCDDFLGTKLFYNQITL